MQVGGAEIVQVPQRSAHRDSRGRFAGASRASTAFVAADTADMSLLRHQTQIIKG